MSSRRGSVEPDSSQETVVPPRRRSCEDEPEDRGAPGPFYLSRATTPTEPPSSSPRLPGRQRTTQAPAADKDPETHTMPSGSSTKHRDAKSEHHSSSSRARREKTDDWTDVTEPGERRRIQNRNAQRKYREKAKEQREASERDSRNREHAGGSYHVPRPDDLLDDEEVSGLPWGGISMRHVYARSHESQSRRGSGRDDYPRDDYPRDDYPRDDGPFYSSPTDPQGSASYGDSQQSYGDSAGDFADDTAYCYMDYDNGGGGYSHTWTGTSP